MVILCDSIQFNVFADQKASRGQGLVIHYGVSASEMGDLLIGQTDQGICWISFLKHHRGHSAEDEMRSRWPVAQFQWIENDSGLGRMIYDDPGALGLDIYGTDFQIKVWRVLLDIPLGETQSYQDIAAAIGKPKAVRAVGTAIGQNPVSILIPCHRVIQASGKLANYAWGLSHKRALLYAESAVLQT